MKTWKNVIFDLDGTLLDTCEDLAASVNFALAKANLPTRPLDEVKSFIGNGVGNLIKRSVPDSLPRGVYDEVLADFRVHYADNIANNTKPFPGIIEVLKQLRERNIKVSVASNKYQRGVERLCEIFFEGLYDTVFGEREGTARKPDPAIIFAALDSLGAAKEQTLYVGDSEVDCETAKNAGIDFVGVSWGLRTKELLHSRGCETVIDEAPRLLEYLV